MLQIQLLACRSNETGDNKFWRTEANLSFFSSNHFGTILKGVAAIEWSNEWHDVWILIP